MSKEEILEHLIEYLQDKIDTNYHKIFYNDDMYDEKTIDCINAINNTLEENQRLHSIIKEAREYIEWHYDLGTMENIEFCFLRDKLLKILDKENK